MDLKAAHQFFNLLDEKIQALGVETTYVEGIRSPQLGDTLRFLLPVTEEGDPVIMEVMVTELTDDADLLHIYSTLITALGEKAAELPQKLSEWNLLCPLGAYGIYEEEGQLFHKYTLPFPREAEADLLADDAMFLIELIHSVLSQKYPELREYEAQ